MSPRLFEAQLRRLRSHYRVVPPSSLLDEVRRRRFGGRLPVALTFDDDLTSHVDAALPVLTRLGLPAGFFLCGASLERQHSFWWEDLQRAVDDGAPALLDVAAPPEGDLRAALARERGALRAFARVLECVSPTERSRVASELRRVVGPPVGRSLDGADIRALAAAGFEIGFHTLRHEPLPTLDDAQLARALEDGRAQLEHVVGRPVRTFAYPHGRAAAREAGAAHAAGYSCAFTGRPEAVRMGDDPHLLGRIEPSFESMEVFEAQLGRALKSARR
jgi:peptidoglycan/xylan/chitin deacetylase (PgdA/CDA1 family)